MRLPASAPLSLAAAAFLNFASPLPGNAQSFEPIVRSVVKADLAEAADMAAWKAELAKVGGGMAYIDWQLLHFMASPALASMLPSTATPRDTDTACQFLEQTPRQQLRMNGAVDGGDNHLFLDLRADLSDLPDFALITCEQYIGTGEIALRIRGFYYLPDVMIETASMNLMLPITIDAMRIPDNTFR